MRLTVAFVALFAVVVNAGVCPITCEPGAIFKPPCSCIPEVKAREPICHIFCDDGFKFVAPCSCVPITKREPAPICPLVCPDGEVLKPPCRCVPE